MTNPTIIRGKIRSKEIRPGYKTTGGIVVHPMDSKRGSVPVAVLIGGGEKMGRFEPWMARFLDAEAFHVREEGYPGLGKKHRAIAAAISELFQEGE